MRMLAAAGFGLMMLLGACSTAPPRQQAVSDTPLTAPPLRPDLFGAPLDVPRVEALHTLTDAQQAEFLAYFSDPVRAGQKPHARIYGYLERRLGSFTYYAKTLAAADALDQNQGNCLSLALVTTALAELGGVDYGFQRIRNRPVYESRQDFVMVADHLRTRLYDPTFIPDPVAGRLTRPFIEVDYFPERGQRYGGQVAGDEVAAMYYVNLAGESLVDGDLSRSYWLLDAALTQAPDNPGALNSMAVLHRRAGDARTAEALYGHLLAVHGDSLLPLGNLQNLLRDQGRLEEVAALDVRIRQLPVRDPYRLVEFGMQAYADGRLQDALEYYAQALDAAPYMHEIYWRQAMVHHALGNQRHADALLQQARDMAPRVSDQNRYQAKRLALSGVLN